MKKKLFFFLFFCLFGAASIDAQFEVKMSPFIPFAGVGTVSFEYGSNDEWGFDLMIIPFFDFFAVDVSARYYPGPDRGLDGAYVGPFLGTATDIGVGIGFLVGFKRVWPTGVLMDASLGLGRSFNGGLLPFFKLELGYRFKSKKHSP